MKSFAIISRRDDQSHAVKETLKRRLEEGGMAENEAYPDLVIAVGGDGTFLFAVHHYLDRLDHASFLGVHTGTLGFFSEYQLDELDRCVRDVLTQTPEIETQRLLKIELGHKRGVRYALNEMRVENVVKTQILDIEINGCKLETFRGTGICVSTQAGSSAYNRSLGGAIIESGLPLLQLSEITGIHHRAYRSLGSSLILKENSEIRLISAGFEGAMLCYDHLFEELKDETEIRCCQSEKTVRILRYRKMPYLHRLKMLF